MKTKTFIHISDLHIAAKYKPGIENTNPRAEKTWLVAQDDEKNDYYIQEFCDSINDNFKQSECDYYLLVTGDVADASDSTEYKFANLFLKQIQKELKIKEKNILIVPGNHDVSWPLCQQAAEADRNSSILAHERLEAKYSTFKDFYNGFFQETGKTFDPNKQIVDYLELTDEQILIVGINTNYKINYNGGKGAVKKEVLQDELSQLPEKYNEYSKIAVFHHNMVSDSDTDSTCYGSWGQNDWINFKKVLDDNKFKLLLFGNEHTEASNSFQKGNPIMFYSDPGTFALKGGRQSYKVYQLENDGSKTSLKLYLFELAGAGTSGHRSFGYWRDETEGAMRKQQEMLELVLRESTFVKGSLPSKINMKANDFTLLHNSDSKYESPASSKAEEENSYNREEEDKSFRDKIITIIKEQHLFHHGHFHWGKSSRSHNWIDTISLLNDRQHISMIHEEIQKTIQDVKKRMCSFDAVIGLGMEGNIMSAQLLLDDVPYTYMPYTYRYEDFIDCEKDICLDNKNGKYQNILIITDVVNKGRTLKCLIEEKAATFFSQVQQICIISLFYTGKSDYKEMPSGLIDIVDKTIVFHSLVQLEVGECPYKDDTKFKDECAIYKNQLCDISIFYNEK